MKSGNKWLQKTGRMIYIRFIWSKKNFLFDNEFCFLLIIIIIIACRVYVHLWINIFSSRVYIYICIYTTGMEKIMRLFEWSLRMMKNVFDDNAKFRARIFLIGINCLKEKFIIIVYFRASNPWPPWRDSFFEQIMLIKNIHFRQFNVIKNILMKLFVWISQWDWKGKSLIIFYSQLYIFEWLLIYRPDGFRDNKYVHFGRIYINNHAEK